MTIIGVSAQGFVGLDPAVAPQIRVPILMEPVVAPEWFWFHMDDRRTRWVQVFGRLKPGYTIESAQANLQVLFHQIREYEATLPAAKDWSPFDRQQFLTGTIHLQKAAERYSELRNDDPVRPYLKLFIDEAALPSSLPGASRVLGVRLICGIWACVDIQDSVEKKNAGSATTGVRRFSRI